MRWLSQAELRRDTPQSRQLVSQLLAGAEANAGHALVWNLFSDDPDAKRDFLYREVDQGRYLIVSQREPAGLDGLWTLKSRPYGPELKVGALYGFNLRANPTVDISQPGRVRSHRADVIMAAKARAMARGETFTRQDRIRAAQDWLFARSERLGVRFESRAEDIQIGRMDQIKLANKGPGAKLTCVDYQGVLRVTDVERLTHALGHGVGRGKAFGMGLLLLKHLQ